MVNIPLSTKWIFTLLLIVVTNMYGMAPRCNMCNTEVNLKTNGVRLYGAHYSAEGVIEEHNVCLKCLILQGDTVLDQCPVHGCENPTTQTNTTQTKTPITYAQQEEIKKRSEALAVFNQQQRQHLNGGQQGVGNGASQERRGAAAQLTNMRVLSVALKFCCVASSFAWFLTSCRQQAHSSARSLWPIFTSGALCIAAVTSSVCGVPSARQ